MTCMCCFQLLLLNHSRGYHFFLKVAPVEFYSEYIFIESLQLWHREMFRKQTECYGLMVNIPF